MLLTLWNMYKTNPIFNYAKKCICCWLNGWITLIFNSSKHDKQRQHIFHINLQGLHDFPYKNQTKHNNNDNPKLLIKTKCDLYTTKTKYTEIKMKKSKTQMCNCMTQLFKEGKEFWISVGQASNKVYAELHVSDDELL